MAVEGLGGQVTFLYLLSKPGVQLLVFLLYYLLIFLPHVFQDLNEIFTWSGVHLHADLEVTWQMIFLHFLFNNREGQ